jgi:hypothetical protein
VRNKNVLPVASVLISVLAVPSVSCGQQSDVHEQFNTEIVSSFFLTDIPNKNTEIRDGVLWTRGESGGKYPPLVSLGVDGKDLTISFRYRHLEQGGMVWFFVDGDDGYGSVDHMLRVKLMRKGIQLQIDSHSLDPNHPDRQNNSRPADKVSGAYRLNTKYPRESIDLTKNMWHDVRIQFYGETVTITLDEKKWKKTLRYTCFDQEKCKILWMQNGGKKGVELDDIHVTQTIMENEPLGLSPLDAES